MQNKILAVLIGIAVALAIPCRAASQSADLQQAMSLFRQHQWQECVAAFDKVEHEQPGATDALLYEGKCQVNLEQFSDAAISLQAHISKHPDSEDAAYLIAYVRFRENKPKESLQLYTDAGKLKPPTADDLKIVALDYVLLNDYSDAEKYLGIAVKLDPANIEARYHLGRVLYQQNRFDEAIAAFQAVLKQDPDNIKAEDNLGLSFEAKNQSPEAVSAYRKAIQLDQQSIHHSEQPYLDLGTLLAKSNQPENALPVLLQAKEINSKSNQVRYQLGKAYFDLSRFADAQSETEAAVRLNPNDAPTHYLLARIYQRLGKSELAAEQFKLTQTLTLKAATKQAGMASGIQSQ